MKGAPMMNLLMNPLHAWYMAAIGLGIWLVIILITREIWCWYFKVNQLRDLLSDIREELRTLNVKTRSRYDQTPGAPGPAASGSTLPPL